MSLNITPQVTSIAKNGSTALNGAVTLSEGSNVTITQSGNDLSIAASSSSTGTCTFIGSAYIEATTSSVLSRTNTALGSFGAASATPGPTVDIQKGTGTIQTTDTDLPKFTVNSLPAGTYFVEISATVDNNGGTADIAFAINDGTTTSGTYISWNSSTNQDKMVARGVFTYAASGNRTFELYGAASSGTVRILNNSGFRRISFNIMGFSLT